MPKPPNKQWGFTLTYTTTTSPPVTIEWPDRFEHKRDARHAAAGALRVAQHIPANLYVTVSLAKLPPLAETDRKAVRELEDSL
jgi:hypothetical protein